MTALLVHPTCLSLLPLPLAAPSKSTSTSEPATPLPLPSRFPRDATPLTAHCAGAGATFVFAKGYPVVWEYDARGRRIGEIQMEGVGVGAVAGFGGGVVVAAGREIKVFTRSGGTGTSRWAVSQVFEGLHVTAVACDGVWLVAAGETVSAWSLDSGERISLSVDAEFPVTSLGFVGSPPTLVLPSSSGLACVPLAGGMVRDVALPITSVSAMAIGAGGKIALAGPGPDGEVAILDFDTDEVETPRVGHEVAGVAWVDGNTIVARSADGRLFVAGMGGDVQEVKVEETVLGVHVLPSSRPRRSVSERPRVLGESSAPNVQDKRAVSAPAKAARREGHDEKHEIHTEAKLEHTSDESDKAETKPHRHTARVVEPRAAPPSGASTVRIRPAMIAEDDEAAEADIPTPTTSRVSRRTPAPSSGSVTPTAAPQLQPDVVETLRQEIANLQLDMLRMGRGLKNEIRAAVAPLVDEIKSSREVIARQQAEIERLRRGY